MGGDGGLPGWLGGLVEDTFFVECGAHERMKKREKNIYCLDCCTSICAHCAPAHPAHPFLQPYTINSAKVIFLKPRPQSRQFKGSGNICLSCDRILQEPFHYCCLSCKVEHVVMQGRDLLFRFDESGFALERMDGSDVDDDGCHDGLAGVFGGGPGASEVAGRKKGGHGFFPGIVLSLGRRRKGAPHRSPLS